ncbi:MAG: SIMPL domain-containing protein [Mariniblastus sp.]|nr:SIMPL domain-containing protein [Mariniblastus sp.]
MKVTRLFNLVHIPLLLLLVFATALPCFVMADEGQPPTIKVSGSAEIRTAPDEAVLTFSIESREEKLDDAVNDNDSRIKAVTAFLQDSKVEAKYIRTQVISIRSIFDSENKNSAWKGQIAQQLPNAAPRPLIVVPDKQKKIKPIGYIARRQLSITIKDLEAFEDIYRGLIARGVNDVGGIQFRTTELRRFKDEARLKAVRAAREKATAMAGELGAKLSSVQAITENSGSGYMNFSQNNISSAAFNDSESSVAAGEISISARVEVVFQLGETSMDK